jgi:hypothetical protein
VTAIDKFGVLICVTIRDKKSAEIFSNVASFSAILKCFHRSKTSEDAAEIAWSIKCILDENPSSIKILNSLPVVEAFSFIIPLADGAWTVKYILYALEKILNDNEEAQQKFATPEFLEVLQGAKKHATTDKSNEPFQMVLELLPKK